MTNITPNFIRVNNLKNDTTIYVAIENFEAMKSNLGFECIYEKVYISPNDTIYRTEMFKNAN